ncbi:hypothetical protein IU501_29200 [Nocardia otitidiscaviarum]|uniref:Lipoprotein n=1 Tax=Nocardia otitidiscaviarum TaxID=1823 RepID=A0A378YA95_9NOCA|nr:hypothetical protein [Nocardia otitidiscaviarum]MBF6137059.1 hypothetical protein [Nocardia otitidiscaviarum]MBF6237664.1 hypothetical protein [Nocardia otitidiscaviarum]MBF6487958.1 hypothetical protein [Nocardia otitidiscaviarum]SUA74142.1 Uncharacterised protein [Nocardia otitidiscaviarum]
MRISLLAAAFVALPLLAACGSDSAEAPAVTQADLSKALQDSGLKDTALADCAAKLYVDEGISQDGLRVMIDKEANVTGSVEPEELGMSKEDSDKAKAATNRIVSECLQ